MWRWLKSWFVAERHDEIYAQFMSDDLTAEEQVIQRCWQTGHTVCGYVDSDGELSVVEYPDEKN